MSIDEAFMFFLTNKNFINVLSNQQSYFLTSDIDIDEYNKNTNRIEKHVSSNWYLITKKISKDSVVESINKNNITVLFFEDPDLYKKVFSIYGLNNNDTIGYNKKANESVETDLELYNKYYDKIYEINEIDIEVYNTLKEKMK
jgi:esterase/lipase superfamily enzyme